MNAPAIVIAERGARPTAAGVRPVVTAIVILWFAGVVAAHYAGLLRVGPGNLPVPFGVAIAVPIAIFFASYWAVQRFRAAVLGVDLRLVTSVQAWRVARLRLPAAARLRPPAGSVRLARRARRRRSRARGTLGCLARRQGRELRHDPRVRHLPLAWPPGCRERTWHLHDHLGNRLGVDQPDERRDRGNAALVDSRLPRARLRDPARGRPVECTGPAPGPVI